MSSEVFNNPYKQTKVWSTQGATITYALQTKNNRYNNFGGSGNKDLPIAVTGFEISLARKPSPMYSINTDNAGQLTKYMMLGAPEGTLDLGGVMAPDTEIQKFIKTVSNPCYAVTFTINPMGYSCVDSSSNEKKICTIRVSGAVMTGFGFRQNVSQSAGGMSTITFPLRFDITGVSLDDK